MEKSYYVFSAKIPHLSQTWFKGNLAGKPGGFHGFYGKHGKNMVKTW